jgi:photosystem II stability/assembly factor-like uncharacterized protein
MFRIPPRFAEPAAALPVFAILALNSVGAQGTRPPAAPARTQASVPKMPMMASVDSALFRGLTYRLVGHSRGGRVTTVTGVPSQPRTFYMGVASGGLFRTTDGGLNWEPITDGKVPAPSMGSVAVADVDPNIIYLGTGSDGVRSNVSTGRGVYKTTDGGKTWAFMGLYNAGQIGAVRIHPTDPNTVWVAAYGDIFKPNNERGVFKTTDGGRTWRKTLYVNDSTGAMDVELQPGNPNVVYAWMNRIERKPWSIISGSREGGMWRSTDGGDTWTKITSGLPTGLIGKGNLAVTAANAARVYALVEAKPGGGLYRSDDAGLNWTQVNSNPALVQRPFYYTTLGADPTNADVVYAGAEGFFKSTDGGRTMVGMRTPHGDNHDIWINPNDGNTMIQSNDGGANVSFDGGRTWSTQMNQVTSEIYGVWIDNAFPYKLYGAQQDNSTTIYSSIANPYDLNAWRDGPGCETGPIIPHPKDPNIVYGNCKGQFEYMSMNTGQTRNYWVGGQSLYGNPGKDLILRFQRTTPMATSPHDPEIVYYGSQKLHRTRDKGVTWETISPDLTWNPPHAQGPSGEPITRDITGEEFYSTLYAITESPHQAGVIWVGSNDGPFHVTRDNGKSWTNVTPKDLQPGGRVAWIDASPHRPGSAYYAVYRYLLGDYAPYIYKTEDYGRTWTRLTNGQNGIPADWPTRVVREDPSREGLLYAGTEFGMFVSFDNGAHWQPFLLNMPNVPINDIKVHKKDLVIATQGRGIWILDNLSSLHQITPQLSTSRAHLYRARDGYRTRDGADILGPMVEYYLPSEMPVKIDIVDASGAAVNSYNSETPAAGAGRGGRGGRGGAAPDDPDQPSGRGRGGSPPPRVTKNAGHNRFVWDVRHSSTLTAPPGRYVARLTIGSDTMSTPLTVLIDPRLATEGLTTADLKEQFDHNLKMRDMVAEVGRVRQRIQSTMARLANASGAAADTLSKVQAVAAKVETEPVRYGKPGIQAHISYLAGMTSGNDQKIGRDAIARYAVLRKELDAIKAELDRILGPIM